MAPADPAVPTSETQVEPRLSRLGLSLARHASKPGCKLSATRDERVKRTQSLFTPSLPPGDHFRSATGGGRRQGGSVKPSSCHRSICDSRGDVLQLMS